MRDLAVFATAAARRPTTIGAIAPSSSTLSDRLAAVVPRTGHPTVVELGPGTGATTAAIARRLPQTGRLLGVELDSALVDHLRRSNAPLDVVPGDAADLRALLAAYGVDRADAVVGGLPWALFPPVRQDRILREVVGLLGAGGVFTTFAYAHALASGSARRFRRRLHGLFDEVLVTSTVWRNAPPAVTYVCRRPFDAAGLRRA